MGDNIHVNGPVDKGSFTRAGLIPSPSDSTNTQVERAKKPGLVFLMVFLGDEGIVSWALGKAGLDSYTMKPTGVHPVPLQSNLVWIRANKCSFPFGPKLGSHANDAAANEEVFVALAMDEKC